MAIKLFAAVLVLLLAFGCTKPPIKPESGKYFEIVHEKESCPNGGCFTEYLFTSGGIVLKKQYNLPNYKGEPTFELRRLASGKAAALLNKAENFSDANQNYTSSSDSINNVFYSGNSKLYSLSFPKAAPGQFQVLYSMAEAEFNTAVPDADFYVHQYYQPITGDTVDFHIFSDGTLIKSVYVLDGSALRSSTITQLSKNETVLLEDIVDNVQGPVQSDFQTCGMDTGLVYGYLELKRNGRVHSTYACGNENNGAAALFAFLKSKYG